MPNIEKRLFALPDFTIQPIDNQAVMLIRSDTGAVAAVDARWQHFLSDLRVFRTLPAHAAVIVNNIPQLRGHEKGLVNGFKDLVSRGLFYSADEFLLKLQSGSYPASPSHKPLTLCIRTCNRPHLLRRLLQSLVENAKRFKSRWPVEILEDSKHSHDCLANRSLAEEFATQLDLRYIGLEEQESFISELCRHQPDDSDSLRWLLDPKHPANVNQSTHGRLYNLAFLMHAGQRILLIDDDTVLRALQLPSVSKQPTFRLQPAPSGFFPDPKTAFSCLQSFDGDPIAAHADYLGLPIAHAIRRMTGSRLDQRLLENQSIDDIPYPNTGTGIIRYTHNGFFGDTGTASDHLRLYKLRLDAPELVVDPEAYLRFRHAPRFAFGGSDKPQILTGTHLHHATCVGLDLSDLMPPVIPTGRSEDGLLASLMRFLYPADAGLRHSFALEHGLEAAKPWAFEAKLLFQPFDASTAASLWTGQLPSGLDLTPPQRWSLLGQSLRNSVESGTLPVRLAGMLERHTNESLSFQFAVIRGELAIHTAKTPNGIQHIPDDSPWRQELEAISYRLSQQLRDSNSAPDTSPELDRICSKIDTYSQALAPWTRAFESSQQ